MLGKLSFIIYYSGEILSGVSCLIILTSIHRLGGLRINNTSGMRQRQDPNPGVSYASICALYVFFLFSHRSSLYANTYWNNYSEKKICVKMNGVDSSLNVEKTIIFQGKVVVCGSAQLWIWVDQTFCREQLWTLTSILGPSSLIAMWPLASFLILSIIFKYSLG